MLTTIDRVITNDVEELRESTKPWDVRISQLERGQFRGVREYLQLGDIILYRESFNRQLMFHGESPPGYFMIGTSISGNSDIIWNGNTLGLDRIACSTQSSELNFSTPDASHHVVMLVPNEIVQHHTDNGLPQNSESATLNIESRVGKQLIQLFDKPFDRYLAYPELLSNTNEASDFESRVLGIINHCFDGSSDDIVPLTSPQRWHILLNALEYFDATENVIKIDQIARELNISQRTLEYAIKKSVGVTPKKLQNLHRLNNVHRELKSAEPDSLARVTEIAGRWGFSELGRFAVEYRQLFGEKPSSTLRKPRARPSIRLADFVDKRPRSYSLV